MEYSVDNVRSVLSNWKNEMFENLKAFLSPELIAAVKNIKNKEKEIADRYTPEVNTYYEAVSRNYRYNTSDLYLFSRKTVAERYPGEIKNGEQLVSYMEKRGYKLIDTIYHPDYIFGIPEYDMYVPRILEFKYMETGAVVYVECHFNNPHDSFRGIMGCSVFYYENSEKKDLGAKYPERKVPYSEVEPVTMYFPYYPENMKYNHSYSDTFYGYDVSVKTGLLLLDYLENPIKYTEGYYKKIGELDEMVQKLAADLIAAGYDIRHDSYAPDSESCTISDSDYIMSRLVNTACITLRSYEYDFNVTFILNKVTMSTIIIFNNHNNVVIKCGFSDIVWADDMPYDEILETVKNAYDIAKCNTDISWRRRPKSKIIASYTEITENPEKISARNMGDLLDNVLDYAIQYQNDPEIGKEATALIEMIKKAAATFNID